MYEVVNQFGIMRCFDGKLRQHAGKRIEVGLDFKAINQYSYEGLEFLFVHNLPAPVGGVDISKQAITQF